MQAPNGEDSRVCIRDSYMQISSLVDGLNATCLRVSQSNNFPRLRVNVSGLGARALFIAP